ncbi:hypothetical protein [Nocardia sp. NPDC051570]|uniref:hypothetical protein n=1 Tax=Nocardia sp. NPDC051570 TaxID=3364324 RepID=UPI00378955C2
MTYPDFHIDIPIPDDQRGYVDINGNPAAQGTFRPEAKPDISQPRKYVQSVQAGTQQFERGLAYDSKDPNYITRMEAFEGIPHEEIYAKVQAMKPDSMQHAADTWVKIATALSGGLMGTHISIQKALSEGIEGQMADAGMEAARQFYKQANDVQEVILTCGYRVQGVAHAAGAVKASVPPPAGPLYGPDVPDKLQGMQVAISDTRPGDSIEAAYQRGVEALRQTAIDAMNTLYKPTYQPAGTGVPTFVPVQAPGDDSSGGGNSQYGPGGTGGGSGLGGTGGGPGGTGGEDGKGGKDSPGDQKDPSTDPASVNPAGADQSSLGGTKSGSSNSPGGGTATTPASASDTSTTPAGLAGGSGGRSGLSTGGGGFGGGRGGFGGSGGGPGANSPGRSLPGVSGGGNPAAAAAFGGRGATPGQAGMPGMGMPQGGKGKGEDDSEHKTPDYLVIDREDELFGARERTTPQAIGADIPAAQTRPDEGEGRRQ